MLSRVNAATMALMKRAAPSTRISAPWKRPTSAALRTLLDDQFVIISATGARSKAEEIADLVPQSGATVEYFRSNETRTRGFGALAVTTGVLQWKFGGRELQRNHATIAVKRGTEWKILAQQVTPRA